MPEKTKKKKVTIPKKKSFPLSIDPGLLKAIKDAFNKKTGRAGIDAFMAEKEFQQRQGRLFT